MPNGTLTSGRFSATLTDLDASGSAEMSIPVGKAFYTALLDGSDWQPLYSGQQSFTTGASVAIPELTFGDPIPLAGPAVLQSIGIRIEFDLTAGDRVVVTSQHDVVPVPEPGTAALVGLGFAFLARSGRDSRGDSQLSG
jgi:hypothetical protein